MCNVKHCVKSVRIRIYSGPHFPAFGLNTVSILSSNAGYSVSVRIQFECGKMGTRITPNTDTFHAVKCLDDSWGFWTTLSNIYDDDFFSKNAKWFLALMKFLAQHNTVVLVEIVPEVFCFELFIHLFVCTFTH